MSIVLQNKRALELLAAEKGGMCLFLNKECFFYTNKFGVVRDMAQQLQERITKRRQRASQFVVLLEQHMELGSLGTTSCWPPFYAPSNTPI
jgi:hypothetical protein